MRLNICLDCMRDVRKTLVWFRFTQSTECTVYLCLGNCIPHVNTIAGMSPDGLPTRLHRCFHETHYTFFPKCHHTVALEFVHKSIYRAQYAFATLKKFVFCCLRTRSDGSYSRARSGISCGCPVIERQDQRILY